MLIAYVHFLIACSKFTMFLLTDDLRPPSPLTFGRGRVLGGLGRGNLIKLPKVGGLRIHEQ